MNNWLVQSKDHVTFLTSETSGLMDLSTLDSSSTPFAPPSKTAHSTMTESTLKSNKSTLTLLVLDSDSMLMRSTLLQTLPWLRFQHMDPTHNGTMTFWLSSPSPQNNQMTSSTSSSPAKELDSRELSSELEPSHGILNPRPNSEDSG